MNNVIKHIEYLIARRDCVIIPGIGALLAKYRSAVSDDDKSLFYAPRRVFAFNFDITDDDATLTHSISRSLGVSLEKATAIMHNEIEAMKHQLREHGELPLGRVGLLSYDASTGVYGFTSFRSDRLSVSTLWLDAVPYRLVDTAESRKTYAATADVINVKTSFTKRAIRIAASVAVLVAIWFLATTTLSLDDAMRASLSPEIPATEIVDTHNNDTDAALPDEVDGVADLYLDQELDYVTQDIETVIEEDTSDNIDIAPTQSNEQTRQSAVADEGKYLVVVASLRSDEETRKFIEKYPRYDLKVRRSGKLYRVYISTHHNKAEANRACNKIRNTFADAWVCY